MDKMRITSSESKVKLGRSGKVLTTSMGLKAKTRPKKYKMAIYAIGNVNKKDLSNITKDFGKPPYESYEKKSPNHEPTNSKFYPAIQLAKCTMRVDDLKLEN